MQRKEQGNPMEHLIKSARLKKGLYWNDSWSIVEGCTPVSQGCFNCWKAQETYMRSFQANEKMKNRYGGLTTVKPSFNGTVRMMPGELNKPKVIGKPSVFLVLNDLFNPGVTDDFIHGAIDVMGLHSRHIYIVLTKKPGRMKEYLESHTWENGQTWWESQPQNIILGTSVEDRKTARERIPILKEIPAAVRVVSFEPILEYIPIEMEWFSSQGCPDCNYYGYIEDVPLASGYTDMKCPKCHCRTNDAIEWAIVGVETGKKRRSCDLPDVEAFVLELQTKSFGMPIFVKALEINGRVVKDIDQFPEDLQLREFPSEEDFERKYAF